MLAASLSASASPLSLSPSCPLKVVISFRVSFKDLAVFTRLLRRQRRRLAQPCSVALNYNDHDGVRGRGGQR